MQLYYLQFVPAQDKSVCASVCLCVCVSVCVFEQMAICQPTFLWQYAVLNCLGPPVFLPLHLLYWDTPVLKWD